MARSYKKHHWCKDGNRSRKKDKQIANRKIRRGGWKIRDIPSGAKYRQITEPWNICDHRFHDTFAGFVKRRQEWYVDCLRRYGEEYANRVAALDWREAYRKWARLHLWK